MKRNTGTQTLKSEVVTTELLWLKLHTLERLIQTIEVDLNIRTEAFLYVNIPTRTRWPNSLQNLVENFSTWTNLSIMCSSLRAASITNAIFRQVVLIARRSRRMYQQSVSQNCCLVTWKGVSFSDSPGRQAPHAHCDCSSLSPFQNKSEVHTAPEWLTSIPFLRS